MMKGSGSWAVEGLHGGPLLAARAASFVVFWYWESGEIVRRIDVEAKNVRTTSTPNEQFFTTRLSRFRGQALETSLPSPPTIRTSFFAQKMDPMIHEDVFWSNRIVIMQHITTQLLYHESEASHAVPAASSPSSDGG